MLKIEETNHKYYCEWWETKRTTECFAKAWKRFMARCNIQHYRKRFERNK